MPDRPDPTRDPAPDLTPARDPAAGEDGRDRLRRALLRPTKRQAVVAVLLALVGFAAVTQFRINDDDSSYSGLREQELIDALDGLAATTQRAQAEIDRLTRTRDQLQSQSTQRGAALAQAQEEVDELQVLAGVVPVSGPGVRITIREVEGTVSVSSMLDVLQELRSTGAEAIQLNGEVRVVAQTAVADGVGGLLVDGATLQAPYVVDAIGVPSTLAGAMTFPLGPRDVLLRDGAEVEVTELSSLDIDAVTEPGGTAG